MDKIFGVPIDTMVIFSACAMAGIVAVVAFLALTNRIFFKLGIRKVLRRPGRTLLIVFGLMLATTIITAAFTTGDTMTHTIRTSAVNGLGNIDETISARKGNSTTPGDSGPATTVPYFDESAFRSLRSAAAGNSLIDGIAPAISEGVAVQDLTRQQNEPRMALSGTDPQYAAGFDVIRAKDGGAVLSVADLGEGEVYLNLKAAANLQAAAGDKLLVFASGRATPMAVKAVVDTQGTGNDGPSMLMSLKGAQRLLAKDGMINYVVVSNRGDVLGGAARTDAVIAALRPAIDDLGLDIHPVKQDALKVANQAGSAFTSVFVTFGMFSISAGLMLIFLIFVMVAAERKSEMGIARAVGTQRRHLVEMFMFEGMVYDVGAAAVGSLVGVGVAFAMVFFLAQAFSTQNLSIVRDVRPASLVVAYSLGVLLTFLIVTFSAWKVSLLNIMTAIRDLPEATTGKRRGRSSWLPGLLLIGFGCLLLWAGLQGRTSATFNIGVSLVIIGFIPLLRRLGIRDRFAYSVPGLLLSLWFILPPKVYQAFLPDMAADFSIFVIAGLMAVVGATWVVMYNSDLVLAAAVAVFGRASRLAPVIKTAVSRSLASRFRTGMAVTMFAIVVMTLVVMAVVRGSIVGKLNDYPTYGAGYDIRATTLQANPVPDMTEALKTAPGVKPDDFTAVGSQSVTMLGARQVGVEDGFESYVVRGVDGAYLDETTLTFARMAPGYASSREVWQALKSDPTLAVIDGYPVPRRSNFDINVTDLKFRLQGFYIEDKEWYPISVEIQDPQTAKTASRTIIGIINDSMSRDALGIQTAQAGLASNFGATVQPNLYLYKLRPGVNGQTETTALERAFLANGMDAVYLRAQLNDDMATQRNFDYLFQGFAGLGLIVGVAALGVISARSVVERRQQIGVLRALGFQRSMVQASFLLESSFVALLGIGLGLLLGLIISWNVVSDQSDRSGLGHITFMVPWLNLGLILVTAYVVSILATWWPARQASRIYPAAALRYE